MNHFGSLFTYYFMVYFYQLLYYNVLVNTSRLKKSQSIKTDRHYKIRISVWAFHKTTKRSPIHRVELFLQHSSKSYYKHHKSHSTIYWSGEFIISKLATMQSFVNVASLQNLNIQRYSYVKRRFRKLCISFTMPKNITLFLLWLFLTSYSPLAVHTQMKIWISVKSIITCVQPLRRHLRKS